MKTLISSIELRIPCRQILAELPMRTVQFLRAAGTQAGVRQALQGGGYRKRDHEEGWRLLRVVCCAGRDDNHQRVQGISESSDGVEGSSIRYPGLDRRLVESLELYRWYSHWSTTARTLITRRDWLIALGLATRRSRNNGIAW